MQQELWIKAARYYLGMVGKYMAPEMMVSTYMKEAVWEGCQNLAMTEIDSEVPFVDVPAPWNRREGV